jgi:hypothetical protein
VEATEDCVVYSIAKAGATSLPCYAKLLGKHLALGRVALAQDQRGPRRSLVAEAEQLSLRNKFGMFYIVTALVLSIGPGLPKLFRIDEKLEYDFILGNWAMLLLVALPLFYFIHVMRMPVSAFGVTRLRWRRALVEAVLASAVLVPPRLPGPKADHGRRGGLRLVAKLP